MSFNSKKKLEDFFVGERKYIVHIEALDGSINKGITYNNVSIINDEHSKNIYFKWEETNDKTMNIDDELPKSILSRYLVPYDEVNDLIHFDINDKYRLLIDIK